MRPTSQPETGFVELPFAVGRRARRAVVWVPADYDPARRWPLIVFLHGYVPDTSLIKPWVLQEAKERVAADNGAILLTPYGRRNSDFQGVGEVDVLRSI